MNLGLVINVGFSRQPQKARYFPHLVLLQPPNLGSQKTCTYWLIYFERLAKEEADPELGSDFGDPWGWAAKGYLTQLEVQQRDSEQRRFKEPGFAAFGKNVQVSMFPCVEAGGGTLVSPPHTSP